MPSQSFPLSHHVPQSDQQPFPSIPRPARLIPSPFPFHSTTLQPLYLITPSYHSHSIPPPPPESFSLPPSPHLSRSHGESPVPRDTPRHPMVSTVIPPPLCPLHPSLTPPDPLVSPDRLLLPPPSTPALQEWPQAVPVPGSPFHHLSLLLTIPVPLSPLPPAIPAPGHSQA